MVNFQKSPKYAKKKTAIGYNDYFWYILTWTKKSDINFIHNLW